MALTRQYATSVGTSATALPGTEYAGWLLKNRDSDETVFIGDSSVTVATGFPIEAGDIFSPPEIAHRSLRGRAEDQLYGVVSTGTADVRVLVPGRINP